MNNRKTLSLNSSNLPDFLESHAGRFIGVGDMISQLALAEKSSSYPPYNLVRIGEDTYEIVMAVAGFKRSEIDVQVHNRQLIIEGSKTHEDSEDEIELLHHGLALRDFRQSFKLFEHIVVKDASLEDGLLRVTLEREIPEHAKPRKIDIK